MWTMGTFAAPDIRGLDYDENIVTLSVLVPIVVTLKLCFVSCLEIRAHCTVHYQLNIKVGAEGWVRPKIKELT